MATVTLGSKAEGSIIKLKENGVLVEFYIAKQNYESGLNGAGRVLVVRKDCYDQRQWHSSNINAYASSAIDTWLNGTYKNLLDANIRTAMGTTKIYYTPGNGNNSKTTWRSPTTPKMRPPCGRMPRRTTRAGPITSLPIRPPPMALRSTSG